LVGSERGENGCEGGRKTGPRDFIRGDEALNEDSKLKRKGKRRFTRTAGETFKKANWKWRALFFSLVCVGQRESGSAEVTYREKKGEASARRKRGGSFRSDPNTKKGQVVENEKSFCRGKRKRLSMV